MALWHGAVIREQRTLINALKQQNEIMKDVLKYQGFHDLETMFQDCPLPYEEDLGTPLGYNAPNIPRKINKNVDNG